MSHGFTGDKSEWGRFDKVAEALNQSGFNVLTFDFSGSGESDDDSLTVDKQIDDLNSAIKFVKSKDYKRIGLFGHSLGGLISLRCYTSEIVTMVLWAPVTNKVKYTWDKRYSKEQLQELRETGYITKIRDVGVRRKIIIDEQMLKDRETVDQKDLLKNIDCPILIIHGKKDESVPYSDSEEAIKLLSSNSKLELVDEAGHGFYEHMDIIIKLSKDWFENHLQR
jgi:pimeloyl-ACP methyl ester carboxylesterase